jgi:hypothetical protein
MMAGFLRSFCVIEQMMPSLRRTSFSALSMSMLPALLAISLGAILARLAQGAGLPSLAIAALRLGLAALIVTPLSFWQSRRALLDISQKQVVLTLGAGFFLGRYV